MSDEPQEQRGVHNPRVVDLIQLDPERDEVVLLMLEARPWGTLPEQGQELEAKFNSYLAYVLDGHMVKQYPQYEGKPVRFELECATAPGSRERPLLTAMENFAASENLAFRVRVTGESA